ncbi:MAG: hypothetical protein H6658_00115 [Ardenticatenaceae bacterium]|nr:hypothetical protein [Ardenticatenaceae bacterium]
MSGITPTANATIRKGRPFFKNAVPWQYGQDWQRTTQLKQQRLSHGGSGISSAANSYHQFDYPENCLVVSRQDHGVTENDDGGSLRYGRYRPCSKGLSLRYACETLNIVVLTTFCKA